MYRYKYNSVTKHFISFVHAASFAVRLFVCLFVCLYVCEYLATPQYRYPSLYFPYFISERRTAHRRVSARIGSLGLVC